MVNRVFIYGRFGGEADRLLTDVLQAMLGSSPSGTTPAPSPPSLALPTEAIEILREPSIFELIGKIYVLSSSRNYVPVTPFGITSYTWYRNYQQALSGNAKFYFAAEHGDKWEVRWMRQESDDTSAYIAVALKHD